MSKAIQHLEFVENATFPSRYPIGAIVAFQPDISRIDGRNMAPIDSSWVEAKVVNVKFTQSKVLYDIAVKDLDGYYEVLPIRDVDSYFILDLPRNEANEGVAMLQSFSDKTGKSLTELERLWEKAKNIVKDQYKKSESDDGFFALVVGVLKKMIGLSNEELLTYVAEGYFDFLIKKPSKDVVNFLKEIWTRNRVAAGYAVIPNKYHDKVKKVVNFGKNVSRHFMTFYNVGNAYLLSYSSNTGEFGIKPYS